MAKRKYTKKNTAYWEELSKRRKYSVSYEGSALERYHKAMREAKQHGGDYQAYVEQYFKISRNLRKKKVNVTQLGKQPTVLTYNEYERKKAITKKKVNPYEAATRQFGLISSNAARALKDALEQGGYRISLQRAQAKQLKLEEWEYIDNYYHTLLRRGYTGKSAQYKMASYFFGS